MRALAALLAVCVALPVLADSPPLPCNWLNEGDMTVRNVQVFADSTASGITVEDYSNANALDGTLYKPRPGPVAALNDFGGARVMNCSTGEFIAISGTFGETVNESLPATEFLRAQIKAGKPVRFADVKKAARAVYGQVIVLKESDQTCGCDFYFPELKPAGMTGFADRTDVEND